MHAEEHNFRVGRDLPYFLSDFKTVFYRQGNVQNHNVRGQSDKLLKPAFAVRGLTAHHPSWIFGEQPPHTHPNDFMVIHDQDSACHNPDKPLLRVVWAR